MSNHARTQGLFEMITALAGEGDRLDRLSEALFVMTRKAPDTLPESVRAKLKAIQRTIIEAQGAAIGMEKDRLMNAIAESLAGLAFDHWWYEDTPPKVS